MVKLRMNPLITSIDDIITHLKTETKVINEKNDKFLHQYHKKFLAVNKLSKM